MGEVVDLPVITRLDIPSEKVLKKAIKEKISDVVVLGWDEKENFYFACSKSDGSDVLWLLEIAKKHLLEAN